MGNLTKKKQRKLTKIKKKCKGLTKKALFCICTELNFKLKKIKKKFGKKKFIFIQKELTGADLNDSIIIKIILKKEHDYQILFQIMVTLYTEILN